MKNILKKIFGEKKSDIQSLLDNPTGDWGNECHFDRYSIYHRVIKEVESLESDDYKVGFGLNHSHYLQVSKKREELGLPLRKDFRERFEHESRDGGWLITGEQIVSKHHPLHDKWLVDTETDIKYHIDTVSNGYHYGDILTLCIRAQGSKSHGCRDWKVLKGGDPETIKRIKENHKRYKLVDKVV